jgi:Fe-S oxidoreductase
VCCGRPLYDYGFLDSAERYLHRVLDVLRPYVRDGVPVVGMEPSCLAVFKDELRKMLPHDDDAARLARNAYHFAEFFGAFGIEPPSLSGQAVLWGHCHHRATGGIEPEQELLERMGLSVDNVQGGCCGLAGSWGFEAGKYDISMNCGEEALLPAVRDASPDTLIVANGFSCKTQIADAGTGRHALHTAQVMKLARSAGAGAGTAAPAARDAGSGPAVPRPSAGRRAARVAAAAVPAAAALGALAVPVVRWSAARFNGGGRSGRR